MSVEQKATHTVEKVDPALVPVLDVPEDETYALTVNEGDGEAVVTFTENPKTLLLSGGGFSHYRGENTVSFKDLQTAGTIHGVITGRSDVSTANADASELFHIMYDLRYISSTSVGITIIRAGYTEQANNFASRSYGIRKLVAQYGATKTIYKIDPAVMNVDKATFTTDKMITKYNLAGDKLIGKDVSHETITTAIAIGASSTVTPTKPNFVAVSMYISGYGGTATNVFITRAEVVAGIDGTRVIYLKGDSSGNPAIAQFQVHNWLDASVDIALNSGVSGWSEIRTVTFIY